MTTNHIPMPEEDYLIKIAKVTYAVQYLEWAILGDLFSEELNQRYPSYQLAEEARGMTGRTSGGILCKLKELEEKTVAETTLNQWLTGGISALEAIREKRNTVAHSRPCTHEGKQRLCRWVPWEQLLIDEGYLDELLQEISNQTCQFLRRRLI